ncbi:uncharacterized protein LOC143041794 [Oratosquilla oratoria]|uniref:uncharacterized protein LOC143041794 n=1 Tax=Oratosquilla oratoria TaxID=337810 RepID=UPI003F75B8CF
MSGSTQDAPCTIICKETQNLNVCAISELPSVSSLSRSIRRWRQVEDNVPPIPQVRHGYLIPDQYCYLDNGLKWLQFDSGEHDTERILIFATDSGNGDIKRARNWAVDGTFKCSPIIYYQLYTLHIQNNDISVPRMFALLPNKTQDTYNKLLTTIKELLHNVEPATVMMDFEKAAINSLLDIFPSSDVTCCLFHLSQNVYKQVVTIGFKQQYHQDDDFSLKVRFLPALAFLPIDDVIDGFEELTDDDFPQELVSYFETYYIRGVRGRGQRRRRVEPVFPIHLWNVHERTENGMPRTNNYVEGFHNALRTSVTNVHPNIWSLIVALKHKEALSTTRIAHLNRGDSVTSKKKYRDANQRIKNC